jgi:hypothetical protein
MKNVAAPAPAAALPDPDPTTRLFKSVLHTLKSNFNDQYEVCLISHSKLCGGNYLYFSSEQGCFLPLIVIACL